MKAGSPTSSYQGLRILEAMRSADKYAEEIYRLIRILPLESNSRVLDFGAGDGVFVEKFVSDGIAVDCVEPDPALRNSLRERGASNLYADLAEAGSTAYDLIYAVNVLEHIEDLTTPLAGIRRALKPDGRFFVFVPAFNVLWTSLDDEVAHIQRFTRSRLTALLTQAGFEIAEHRYFDSLGFPAALAVRALEVVGLFRYSPASVGFYDRAIFPLSKKLDHITHRLLGKNVLAWAYPRRMSANATGLT
jgi:SAM-dependent methyltransferase